MVGTWLGVALVCAGTWYAALRAWVWFVKWCVSQP